KEEAMKIIGEAGVPAGAVFDTLELMKDPSLDARGIMQTIEHPTTGKVKMPAWPVRFDGTPPKVKPSPLLGQHNAEVLGAWRGPGATALPLAAAVGTSGHVTGVDISEPMLGLLQRRVAERGIANLTPLLADAQTHAFEPASIDLLTSRFGVMFFADHLAAFRNL